MGFLPPIEGYSWFPWFFCMIPLVMLLCMFFCFGRRHGSRWMPRCCNRSSTKEIAMLRQEIEELKKKVN